MFEEERRLIAADRYIEYIHPTRTTWGYGDKRRPDRFLVFHYDRLTDIDNILWRARVSCGGGAGGSYKGETVARSPGSVISFEARGRHLRYIIRDETERRTVIHIEQYVQYVYE